MFNDLFLVSLLLTLNRFHSLFQSFNCWLLNKYMLTALVTTSLKEYKKVSLIYRHIIYVLSVYAKSGEQKITGRNYDSYDPKWGLFLPSQAFNYDQSPMPFFINSKKAYQIIEPGDPC